MPKSPTHPLPAGAHVRVVITSTPRRPFEGLAEILAPFGSVPHTYVLRFLTEALPQVRLVRPEWQTPQGCDDDGPYSPPEATSACALSRAAQLTLLRPDRARPVSDKGRK